ncbi:hypothetical protein DdX_19275 [Ditylenchus destructor]|uniref:Uncharacterized protein n=1 Tax=Ditylenchus destructor TaxID=166010 RepID=A0AAD4QXE5_9BILA|nr:hypothetical protein DdX_19275 [Ditylenchus destructor]
MASSSFFRNNFILMVIALCGSSRCFVTGYTFHIYDNVVGEVKNVIKFENSGIAPESTVPELKEMLTLYKLWPRAAKAFYINGGLAREDKQLKFFDPTGTENLVIGFVADPEAKYIFRKENQFIEPFKFVKKVPEATPEAVNQSGALRYHFIVKSDVLGRPLTEVEKTFALNPKSKIQDLENAIKDSGLWPARAKAMYINGRCTSSFQTLESFGQKGNEELFVDFVEDPLPIYTFLVNTGKVYELFRDPDQKFQNKELLITGVIRTPIGPGTTVARLKMKIKKAKKWPQGKKDMIINNMRTCIRNVKVDEDPCEKDLLRYYEWDGLLVIDFV